MRTLPPRENGGNFDVKQLTKGAKLFLPVFKEGALFSTGDGHFAQGDGEVCVTAVEMGATAVVRFKVHKGLATRRNFTGAGVLAHHATSPIRASPPRAFPRRHGHADQRRGRDRGGEPDARLPQRRAQHDRVCCRSAASRREQAYVICSVAVDLRISNVVDVPNYVVSALLPEAIFGD